MTTRNPDDEAIQDIRARLSAADPAADRLSDAERDRLLQTRAAVTTASWEPRKRPGMRKSSRPWRPGSPPRRRRLIITAITVPVLLAATAAGWAASLSPAALRVSPRVACFSAASAGSSHFVVMTASQGQAPTALCAKLWASGAMPGRRPGHYRVPRLAACALRARSETQFGGSGTVGVFPDTTCARLHLARVPAGYPAAARAVSALQGTVERDVNVSRCLSRATIVADANRALARYRMTGWKVTYPFGTSLPARWKDHAVCWGAQVNSAASAIQAYPSVKQAPMGVAATIIGHALQVPAARCLAGRPPQSAATALDRVRIAWRRAGHPNWTLRIAFAGPAARRSAPCYHLESIGESPISHFTLQLGSYATAVRH
jgi:hypothetical protein